MYVFIKKIMNILGLNFRHDSLSALFIKGELWLHASKRGSKLKHTREFPIDAINDCLKIAKPK